MYMRDLCGFVIESFGRGSLIAGSDSRAGWDACMDFASCRELFRLEPAISVSSWCLENRVMIRDSNSPLTHHVPHYDIHLSIYPVAFIFKLKACNAPSCTDGLCGRASHAHCICAKRLSQEHDKRLGLAHSHSLDLPSVSVTVVFFHLPRFLVVDRLIACVDRKSFIK